MTTSVPEIKVTTVVTESKSQGCYDLRTADNWLDDLKTKYILLCVPLPASLAATFSSTINNNTWYLVDADANANTLPMLKIRPLFKLVKSNPYQCPELEDVFCKMVFKLAGITISFPLEFQHGYVEQRLPSVVFLLQKYLQTMSKDLFQYCMVLLGLTMMEEARADNPDVDERKAMAIKATDGTEHAAVNYTQLKHLQGDMSDSDLWQLFRDLGKNVIQFKPHGCAFYERVYMLFVVALAINQLPETFHELQAVNIMKNTPPTWERLQQAAADITMIDEHDGDRAWKTADAISPDNKSSHITLVDKNNANIMHEAFPCLHGRVVFVDSLNTSAQQWFTAASSLPRGKEKYESVFKKAKAMAKSQRIRKIKEIMPDLTTKPGEDPKDTYTKMVHGYKNHLLEHPTAAIPVVLQQLGDLLENQMQSFHTFIPAADDDF